MSFLERVKELCQERKISQRKLEQDLNLGNGTTSKWAKSSPSSETMNRIAEYFNVSVDYLLGKDEQKENAPALNKRDERDIARRLAATLEAMGGEQGALMFDGEPIDDETRELLEMSLRNTLEMGKRLAKQKYSKKPHAKGEGNT